MKKSESAASKLVILNTLLGEHREGDKGKVLSHLNEQERGLYLASRYCYARGSGVDYGYDQRHVDFSILIALGLCDSTMDRDIVVPVIIYHDAGRYKTLEGVTKIDHVSFTQRVLHMFEGQELVMKHMKEWGYSLEKTELASKMVAVHDWHYITRFKPEEELRKNNPLIDVTGNKVPLSRLYEQLLPIAESGIRDTPEFKAFHDADLINIPAVASFAKDYLGRGGTYFNEFTPLEFTLLRFAYFGLLDEAIVPTEVSPERLDFMRKKAKLEKVSPGKAEEAVLKILNNRKKDVTMGYLDLENPLPEVSYRRLLDVLLDSEMDEVMMFTSK